MENIVLCEIVNGNVVVVKIAMELNDRNLPQVIMHLLQMYVWHFKDAVFLCVKA